MWSRRSRRQSVATTPVFVLCRDRLTPLRDLIAWLEDCGIEEIHLLDNDSTFEPLVEYLSTCPHHVVHLGRNVGKHALWTDRRFKRLIAGRRFVYTDPDVVPDSGCPGDALARFDDLLTRYRDVTKVGFGLRIDDLPDHYRFKAQVLAWESQFWAEKLEVEPAVFRAPIDTTFALYRRWQAKAPPIDALRTGFPYVARHTTWYVDSANAPTEERFYAERLAAHGKPETGNPSWSGDALPTSLLSSIERLRSDG